MKTNKDTRQRLFEMMGKIDPTFKTNTNLLTEWNFDKKKGDVEKDDDKDEKKDGKKKWNFEKKEDKESKEHEESETPEEEKEEHEDKEELKEADAPKPKVPVNMIAKVGGKGLNENLYEQPAQPAVAQPVAQATPAQATPAQAAPAQAAQGKPSREDVTKMDNIYNELVQLAESESIKYNSAVRGEIVKAAQIIRNVAIKN